MTVPAHLRVSLDLQSKTAGGQSGELLWPRRRDSPGSWRGVGEPGIRAPPPLDKYRRGRGSSEELAQGFHPREAHFRGMCLLLHLHRSPRRALGGWAQARIARHERFVIFFGAASLCSSLPRTAPGRRCGKIRTGSAARTHTHNTQTQTQFFVTIQTRPKTVSNRPILQARGLKIRLRYFWPTSTRDDGRG